MQFTGPTLRPPTTTPERLFPPGVLVEDRLRVWAMSRWRGPTEFARFFLSCCFRHLPPGSPIMFAVDEVRSSDSGRMLIGLIARFTNPFDAHQLLGQVFWCGCEFICFTTYNIFTNFDYTFPTMNHMHMAPFVAPFFLRASVQAGT